MSGFCGWIDINDKIQDKNAILYNMSETITLNQSNKVGYYQDEYINLGCKCLIKDCINGVKQPIQKICNSYKYVMVYNGEIYNAKDIKEELISNGIHIETTCDTEILLGAYILWKEKCLEHLIGAFSFVIWERDSKKLFMARDHLGIKPLFYTLCHNTLIFSTEIKCILKYPNVEAKIDKEGICQLFGLGPARVQGKCVFKDIYEIKPGSYAIFDSLNNKFKQVQYWQIKSYEHKDSQQETIKNVKEKLSSSIIMQMQSEDNVGTMLSGGIDSSLITAVVQNEYERKGERLNTFSVDYIDNDINFKSNDFQPDSDKKYIEKMKEKYNVSHKNIMLNSQCLIDGLKEAMKARDLPGMADVDVSLLEFCKQIKEHVSIVLSGEFADEIFGGYPWFYKEDALRSDTFPWSPALDIRKRIMNKKYADIDLNKYVKDIYTKEINNVPICCCDDDEESKIKKLMYINMYWFGATLVDRTERMSMQSGLTVRVPFMDYRLIEYVWNIPWNMKTMMGREKGLLRMAYNDVLPKEIVFRKKSPYPKTYDPKYTKKLKEILLNILEDETQPIHKLIDKEEVKLIIEELDSNFTIPWFGQLMTGPQFIAYLIQVNMWLEEYKVEIEP